MNSDGFLYINIIYGEICDKSMRLIIYTTYGLECFRAFFIFLLKGSCTFERS